MNVFKQVDQNWIKILISKTKQKYFVVAATLKLNLSCFAIRRVETI